ncbi:hypothetical protein LCGC14_0336440 [marine sediment metagenome]|uniref:Uncharacterized protein n=1 Tax=marine sediment metagenome TaxID=412755 RepID=A0A0F9TKM0_9ZZZZ
MLDSLTVEQWNEQLAFDSIEGDSLERIAAILKLGFAAICQVWGADLTVDHFEPLESRKSVESDGYTPPNAQVAVLRTQIDSTGR